MGGNSSKSAVQQTNEFLNQTTNSFVSQNSQTVSATALNLNKLNFQGATFKGCRVAIRQVIDSDVIATGEMTSQSIQDLTTKLKADASAAIDNAAAQKNGFLSPAIANNTSATTDLKNKVTNIIQNTMSSTNVQNIFANAANTNDADFSHLYYECDPQFKSQGQCKADDASGCDLVVDQNIKSKLVAKGVADAITKALSNVITESTTTANVTQSATQANAGADSVITAWFQGMSSITAVFGCIAFMLILAVMYGVYKVMSSEAVTEAAKGAADGGGAGGVQGLLSLASKFKK
jgi:hypothetical protein